MIIEDAGHEKDNVLLDKSDTDKFKEEEGSSYMTEFSGVGAVAGYTAPLGMNPDVVGRKKNKGSYNIDYASTVEDAYDELNKIIGSDGVKRLTADTQGLMKQQIQLTEAMSEMQPMIDQMGPLMDRVQTMMGGLNMLKDDKKEGVTNIRDRKIGKDPTQVGSVGSD